ncbi:MAG: hypothetical protein SH817_08390 [Leptospira sp.]|nr:hypothetical protein [Leptospira sp.]
MSTFPDILNELLREEDMNGPKRNIEKNVQDVKTAMDIQKNMAKLTEFQRMNRSLNDLSNPLGRVFK